MDDCTPIAGHFDSHGSCAKQNALPNAACPGLHTKATGRCRWATALSVLPRRLPGQHQTKQWWQMHQLCYPFWWPWWYAGGSWLSSKCRHWASTCSDNINQTCQRRLFVVYFIVKSPKNTTIALNNNRCMRCQTDEKHLSNLREYFVAKIACYSLYTHFLLRVIYQ